MAKLKYTPKNFTEAREVLQGRESVRLGNNTYLERHFTGIVVRLHSTNIVVFHEDGRTVLFTGGYRTITTKERLNQFIKGRIYQKNYSWYYVVNRGELGIDWSKPVDFTEGMEAA